MISHRHPHPTDPINDNPIRDVLYLNLFLSSKESSKNLLPIGNQQERLVLKENQVTPLNNSASDPEALNYWRGGFVEGEGVSLRVC